MKIYTNLNPQNVLFHQLSLAIKLYNVDLITGVSEIPITTPDKIIFWFAKSNATKLHYYRITEALESILDGLRKIETHKELIK
jgi:hypothetical protein